ncbi:hypothetical protein CEXT_813131 [Caerostris extrusa]|uniref:Uncharacterized protein n=1 Tax=Caerostris extrusa TaxID=172846 RepID=A0AAV4QXF0_CAEEX|nr:hypothetical protein CEXT_813131 [Caerostris extrusa]
MLESELEEKYLRNAWMGLKTEYPDLVRTATNIILLFGSTYLREVKFFAMTVIKIQVLELEPDLRLTLTRDIQSEIFRYY